MFLRGQNLSPELSPQTMNPEPHPLTAEPSSVDSDVPIFPGSLYSPVEGTLNPTACVASEWPSGAAASFSFFLSFAKKFIEGVYGSEFRVQGLGFWASGSRFRVQVLLGAKAPIYRSTRI